jgi:hypothetical protein
MCGSTTAWAHVHRGAWAQAARANLAGMLLCVVVAIASPWLWIAAARGAWPVAAPKFRLGLLLALVWLAVAGLDWLRRIFLGG